MGFLKALASLPCDPISYHLIVIYGVTSLFERLLGTSGFWEGLWHYIVDNLYTTDYVFRVIVTAVFGFLLFWTLASAFYVADITGSLKKYKVEDTTNEHATKQEIFKAITRTMFNQLFWGVLQSTVWYQLMIRVLSPHENDDIYAVPSIWIVTRDLFISQQLFEISFYCIHRIMHWKPIYNRVHKVHHEWRSPIGVAAIYNHPLEMLTGSFFPQVIGPVLLRMHMCTQIVGLIMLLVSVVSEHSGYHLPLLKSARFHYFHHKHIDQCFGANGALDYIFGTDTKFRKSKEFRQHRVFLTMELIKTE